MIRSSSKFTRSHMRFQFFFQEVTPRIPFMLYAVTQRATSRELCGRLVIVTPLVCISPYLPCHIIYIYIYIYIYTHTFHVKRPIVSLIVTETNVIFNVNFILFANLYLLQKANHLNRVCVHYVTIHYTCVHNQHVHIK